MNMFVDPSDIYLHLDAVDFRKSINGLIIVVEQQLELSPFINLRLGEQVGQKVKAFGLKFMNLNLTQESN